MTRLFLDTEFSGLTQQAELLSVALIDENHNWFYGVFDEPDWTQLSSWHQEHVVPYLAFSAEEYMDLPGEGTYLKLDRRNVMEGLMQWLSKYEKVQIWADVPAYDWVLFCELFGGALSLPKPIHYVVRDLATLLEAKGYDVDVDRWGLAFGGAEVVKSSDGRGDDLSPDPSYESVAPPPDSAKERGDVTFTTLLGDFDSAPNGLVKHNALGDAWAGMEVLKKLLANPGNV
ncbi:MAG: 3'-5' exoribonuclease [Bacteroidota bacterium]